MAWDLDYLVVRNATWLAQRMALRPADWRCGFCSQAVGEAEGWQATMSSGDYVASVMICPRCRRPTYFEGNKPPFPEPLPGEAIPHVPEPVHGMYEEARACVMSGAYRSAALACRTTLMYVATELNNKTQIEGGFKANVEWLFKNGWIPPNGKAWVDYIKDRGNDATHEILVADPELARQLVDFLAMLLRYAYDMPNRLVPPATPDAAAP
jgi:hypothetical protein